MRAHPNGHSALRAPDSRREAPARSVRIRVRAPGQKTSASSRASGTQSSCGTDSIPGNEKQEGLLRAPVLEPLKLPTGALRPARIRIRTPSRWAWRRARPLTRCRATERQGLGIGLAPISCPGVGVPSAGLSDRRKNSARARSSGRVTFRLNGAPLHHHHLAPDPLHQRGVVRVGDAGLGGRPRRPRRSSPSERSGASGHARPRPWGRVCDDPLPHPPPA